MSQLTEALDKIAAKYTGTDFSITTFRLAIVDTALAHVGVREEGENAGPEVTKFLGELGLNPGLPWCMAFVQHIYKLASGYFKLKDILAFNSAGTQAVWRDAVADGYAITDPSQALVGDSIIWRNGATDSGHTGIIVKTDGQRIVTVEGNVSSKSWRDGGGVELREFSALKWGKWGAAQKIGRWTRGALSVEAMVRKENPGL